MQTSLLKKYSVNCIKTICLFFILVWPFLAVAQDEAQLLINKMKQAEGVVKADLLNEISVVYRKSDRYKSMEYARQAYSHSERNGYLPGKALAKKNEGICWFFIGNNDSATICYKEALGIFSKIDNKKGVSACYNNLGLVAQETGKYKEALRYYERSVEMDKQLGDATGVAQTTQNMADIYIYLGEYRNALFLTNQCLKIYTEQSDKLGILQSYCNRGAEYDYLKLFYESERDYLKALQLAREQKDLYMEILVNSNLGAMYWNWKKPEQAMKYLVTALEMSDEADDAYDIDNTLKTIAEIYTSQKKYIEANEIYQKILNRNVELENKRRVATILTAIGRNLIELNEIDKALGYLKKSLEITVKLNTPLELLENYRNLAHANAILHNFQAADSLQDLFAQKYSELESNDSITGFKKEKVNFSYKTTSSVSEVNKWIIAFLLLILILILSVFGFREYRKQVK